MAAAPAPSGRSVTFAVVRETCRGRPPRIPRDGCLVPAEPFAELVQQFVRNWNRDRPQPGGQYGLEDKPPVRALAWLSAEATRVCGGVVVGDTRIDFTITEGMLEGLLDRRRPPVALELRVADAIATALHQPFVMYEERVVVMPNPAATREAQESCCSGSSQAAVA